MRCTSRLRPTVPAPATLAPSHSSAAVRLSAPACLLVQKRTAATAEAPVKKGTVATAEPPVKPDLSVKIPGRYKVAKTFPLKAYKPAESLQDLQAVNVTLKDWFEHDENWNENHNYVGFGPRQKVTERDRLVAIVRRAVIEAQVVKLARPEALTRTWATGGAEAMRRALGCSDVPTTLDGAGEHGLMGVRLVFRCLFPKNPAIARLGEKRGSVAAEVPVEEDAELASFPETFWQEMEERQRSGTSGWKQVSVEDPVMKFVIAKRVQQLSGQRFPDAKLAEVEVAGHLISALIKPEKPKKLAEELQSNAELISLPNVTIHARRVTPIDKHKMVGRWKVIKEELEKRNLPVIGTGGHSKMKEITWATGKM